MIQNQPSRLVFLSSPYTSIDPKVTERRVQQLLRVDAHLMRLGTFTISPVYKHLLVQADLELPSTWEYWKGYCQVLLSRCDSMLIVPSGGWEDSTGVKGEIEIALSLGVPYSIFNLLELESPDR